MHISIYLLDMTLFPPYMKVFLRFFPCPLCRSQVDRVGLCLPCRWQSCCSQNPYVDWISSRRCRAMFPVWMIVMLPSKTILGWIGPDLAWTSSNLSYVVPKCLDLKVGVLALDGFLLMAIEHLHFHNGRHFLLIMLSP